MAITELTRIDTSIRNGNANAPSLGCGGTFVAAGTDLPPGDYVAIQLLGGTGTLTLTAVTYVGGREILDIAGAPVTGFTLLPTKGEALWWIPVKSCTTATVNAIFYRRCS
jgi:hypothetical protein